MPWEPNKLERERLEKLERLRQRGIDPYPNRTERTHSAAQAVADFLAAEAENIPVEVTVCGRIRAKRGPFADIYDGSGKIQIYIHKNNVGQDTFKTFQKDIDLGDFVQVRGEVFRTKTGEITVRATELKVLAKALSPLPVIKEKVVDGKVVRYTDFSDVEERYRQRYVDLAVNPDVRERFRTRARIIRATRDFLDSLGFLEVETPILHPVYGGAAARPFVTHHNQLHQDLYLRISFELYLKRLLVGMYDAVYEIGRDFRNEGVSFKHNPEFTQLEFYLAYSDYHGMMELVEKLFEHVAREVTGSTTITYQGHEIDLSPPWRRITLRQAIREHTGIDYAEHPDADSLREAMRKAGYEARPDDSWGKLIDHLLGSQVEPHLIQPTFVLDYPRDISPLAKMKPGDPTHVERFEFFIGGMEMGNAFTEINDPLDQEERFLEMGRLYKPDSEEAHPVDEDFLRALRYGMPPAGGCGVGIDRMTMLFTDQSTIREVLLFPHLRERG